MIFKIVPQGQSDYYLFIYWEIESQDTLLAVGHPAVFHPPNPQSYSHPQHIIHSGPQCSLFCFQKLV